MIADAAGASADTEMLGRAHHSLRAFFQNLNTKKWEFALTEASPVQVIAPFIVTGVTASGGSASANAPAGHGLKPDDIIIASGFIRGARITATAASSFGFNGTVSGFTGTSVIDVSAIRDQYDLPTDWKAVYSVRLLGSNRTLQPIRRRLYERITYDEFTVSTPDAYDVFQIGAKGKIRLLPAPGSSDVLQLRYYRRTFMASASAASTALDIPEDYEYVPLAWGKWHFLTDKNDSSEQAGTWLALSQDGLKTMMADQIDIPDEGVMFSPGAYTSDPSRNINSTRWPQYDYA